MENEYINGEMGARSIKNGEWYWISKAVMQNYATKIKSIGIAVYNLLASLADGKQCCFPSQKYIAKSLGCSRTTISKTLNLLEKQGLILIVKRSRYRCVYQLLNVRCKREETQMFTESYSDVHQMSTNNNKLTKIINKKEDGIKKFDSSFRPETREELLAYDLATAFNDFENLSRYLTLAKYYPENLLRQILSETKEIPDSKIKTSRSAIFNYFVKKYVRQNNHYPGN